MRDKESVSVLIEMLYGGEIITSVAISDGIDVRRQNFKRILMREKRI